MKYPNSYMALINEVSFAQSIDNDAKNMMKGYENILLS